MTDMLIYVDGGADELAAVVEQLVRKGLGFKAEGTTNGGWLIRLTGAH